MSPEGSQARLGFLTRNYEGIEERFELDRERRLHSSRFPETAYEILGSIPHESATYIALPQDILPDPGVIAPHEGLTVHLGLPFRNLGGNIYQCTLPIEFARFGSRLILADTADGLLKESVKGIASNAQRITYHGTFDDFEPTEPPLRFSPAEGVSIAIFVPSLRGIYEMKMRTRGEQKDVLCYNARTPHLIILGQGVAFSRITAPLIDPTGKGRTDAPPVNLRTLLAPGGFTQVVKRRKI